MRCHHSGPRGQCPYQAIDSSHYCEKHTNEERRIMNYRIDDPELRERLSHHGALSIETVRDEVALMRALMEERINLAKTPAEKIAAFNVVTPAINALDKLVNSIQKLELNASLSLEKGAARKLAEDIGKILIEELRDVPDRDNIIDRVSRRIAEAVMAARNSTAS